MSSAQATRLNPVCVGSDNILNTDSGKFPKQIGCLIAKLQGMDLEGKRQYRKMSVESDDDLADTKSSDLGNKTILYPKKELSPKLKEEAFNIKNWQKPTHKLVTLMQKVTNYNTLQNQVTDNFGWPYPKHQTHKFVPIFNKGNDKPTFVGRIVPARSCGAIPSLPSSHACCASPYDRIYAPKIDINSLFDDLCPFVNPVQPKFGNEVFNYASNLKMPLSTITHETFLLGPKGQSAIPTTFEEACAGPDWLLWMPAFNKEINTFWDKGVWSFAQRPEDNSLVVDLRLVFTIKHDKQGKPHTYKVQIVAKGFTQQPGKNYNFTNSPTPSLDIICTTMAAAVKQNLKIHQINVQSAFLNALLDEEIYMEMPPGYKHPNYPRDKFVMRLHKAVYGLKQLPRMFNIAYSEQLCSIGYVPHPTEPCVFCCKEYSNNCEGEYNPQIKSYTYLGIYVNDLMVCATAEVLETVKSEIMAIFPSQDLGQIQHFMGMKVDYNQSKRTLKISMPDYIRQLAIQFGLKKAAPKRDPISATHGLKRGPRVTNPAALSFYATAMGALLWPALTVCPKIAFTVLLLSSANHFFTKPHLNAIKHLIVYLANLANNGITYNGRQKFIKYTFANANWGSDYDGKQKSQSGYVVMLAGGAIAWASKRQHLVALSTKEAKFYAVSEAIVATLTTQQNLRGLGYKLDTPTIVFNDNQGLIATFSDPLTDPRPKHIDIKFNFACDVANN
ncbi:GAG-pre-integrase domain, partial [Rhizoctonia solani]